MKRTKGESIDDADRRRLSLEEEASFSPPEPSLFFSSRLFLQQLIKSPMTHAMQRVVVALEWLPKFETRER